eukprot:515919_1
MSVEIASDNGILYYYTSAIGSIIAIIVITILLIHTLHHYIKIFHRSNDNIPQDKCIYILYFTIALLSLFICIQYAFVNSNLFTRKTVDDFSSIQCAFSHFSSLTGIVIGSMCVYTLLIRRIEIAFQNSMYKYPKQLYIILHSLLLIGSAASLTFLYISLPNYEYILYYFNSTDYLYCTAETARNTSTVLYDFIGLCIFITVQISYNIILLYLFTKRLYALQIQLVQQHIKEKHKIRMTDYTEKKGHAVMDSDTGIDSTGTFVDSGDESFPKSTKSKSNLDVPATAADFVNVKKRTFSVEDVIYAAKNENDYGAQRIMSLHKLIKKHTILIVIGICSSIIWLLVNYFISDWFWIEIVWLLMINNIILWLMFQSAEKYWKFTTRYCFCCVCYYCCCCRKKK